MVPYQFDALMADPGTILRIWDGGMSFHGGISGVAIALTYFAWSRKVSLFSIGDIAGVVAPIGIGLVRLYRPICRCPNYRPAVWNPAQCLRETPCPRENPCGGHRVRH